MTNPVTFTILENGNLRISLNVGMEKDLREILDRELGDFGALLDATEQYWTNGWGVHSASQLGQLSDAPVICEDSTVEDDGSITLNGRSWYYLPYMVFSPLEKIWENGYVDFQYWHTFESYMEAVESRDTEELEEFLR